MSDYSDKRQQALEACENVINGLENENFPVLSALLQCIKIARLVGDIDGQEWLEYELSGYPIDQKGVILPPAWEQVKKHGRFFKEEKPFSKGTYIDVLFPELCAELETSIKSMQAALNNFTTQGFSVAGENAHIATSRLTDEVSKRTYKLIMDIKRGEKRLSILKSQYYNYAVKWQIELSFGHLTKKVFDSYQERIDQYYSSLPSSILQKIKAIESSMQDDNPEKYAHVLTSCRRLWSEIANHLFSEAFPNLPDTYKTISGKTIDISEGHDNNRLSAAIEIIQSKAAKNTLVGSGLLYLVDWLKQINDIQNAGVHSNVTKEQAERCIIHTYIALGDILSLKAEADKTSTSDGNQQP